MEPIANRDALLKDTVRILRRQRKFPRVVAVILLGSPGSGKFEIAERLDQELGLTHIPADKLLEFLAPRANLFDDLDRVTEFALEVMVDLGRDGYSSVLDRNVARKGYREKFKLDIEAVGGQLVEVEVICPDDVAFGNIVRDNHDIAIGERTGQILDRDYWLFKKSQVEPPIGENRYSLSCQYKEEDWERFLNFLKLKLTS